MTQLSWKRRLGALLGGKPDLPRKVVLLYHALGEQPPALPRDHFALQLDWLAQNASVISLSQLLAIPCSGLQVTLSFDDGYASLFDDVAPMLRERGMNAVVYINTAHIGQQRRQQSDPALGHYPAQQFLLWSEVKALADAGWEIGSHGVHHLDLAQLPAAEVCRELQDSKLDIVRNLQLSCDHFAYPWGRYTPALKASVRDAGYLSAASGTHGPLLTDSDRFALPRIDVRAEYELEDFIAAVTGRWDWLRFKHQLTTRLR